MKSCSLKFCESYTAKHIDIESFIHEAYSVYLESSVLMKKKKSLRSFIHISPAMLNFALAIARTYENSGFISLWKILELAEENKEKKNLILNSLVKCRGSTIK